MDWINILVSEGATTSAAILQRSCLEVVQNNPQSIHIVRLLTGLHGISLDEAIIAFLRSSLDLYCLDEE